MKLQALVPKFTRKLIPFFPVPVPAGPANAIEQDCEWIDIALVLAGDKDVVFIRALGLSMASKDENRIDDGDLLVVHRHGFAEPNDVVIAEVNGEFTLKRLRHHAHGLYLVPANDAYPIRQIKRQDDFAVWGVVKYVIHKIHRRAA